MHTAAHPRAAAGRVHRRFVIIAMALVLLISTQARGGEVVIVLSGDATPYLQAEAGFRDEFAGKRDVRTVQLRDVSAGGVEETIGKNPDAVVAVGTLAANYLHRQLPEQTPLTYCMVADPAQAGLFDGHSIHGVTTTVSDSEQFNLIAEALPHGRSVGILYRSDTAAGRDLLKRVHDALPSGWRLEAVAVDQYSSVADAIDDLTARKVDLIWTSLDAGVYDNATVRALLLAALRNSIPVFGYSPAFVKAGAMIGIGVDPHDQGKQAADITSRELDRPGEAALPGADPPEKFQIALNLIVADQIGIELPQELIERATYLFKESK
ncbi:MAG: ABC transporter substrate binding protein [Tepidisphaeraceae bacterium]